MTLVGLDWNATRARAVLGPAGDYALPVPLEPPALDLPMAVSLEKGTPQVGSAGRRLARQAPHLVCQDFLPAVGLPAGHGPRWRAGRLTLDAAGAAGAVWQRLQAVCRAAQGVVLAVPGYLARAQADALRALGERARVPVLGSVPAPLAAALAAHAEQFWSRCVLVADVDDHALTLALVRGTAAQAHLADTRSLPALGLRHWQDRLINAAADVCVWQTRRDPRDSPAAEQALYEQLDALADAVAQQRGIQLAVQAGSWYHHLLIQPEEAVGFCASLAAQAIEEADQLARRAGDEVPAGIVLTHQAGLLPGLADAVRALVDGWPRPGEAGPRGGRAAADDFGEGLIPDVAEELGGVLVLPPDGPARAAHALADRFRRGELTRGHQAHLAPLSGPPPVDAGPARLHFRGQDYFVRDQSFVLGSQPGCHLRFDPDRHPEVAGRHCEILTDRRSFVLSNCGPPGSTLVNDHPVNGSVVLHAGDSIRLGLHGPALRFLGRAAHRPLPTTA